jgi:acyl-CoA synthetase (AMP-forming)/AMP-acid ligase II
VTAVIVRDPAVALSESELVTFCRERLAPYKTPKSIIFQPDLPRNAMGKVQKADLRRALCADPDSRSS